MEDCGQNSLKGDIKNSGLDINTKFKMFIRLSTWRYAVSSWIYESRVQEKGSRQIRKFGSQGQLSLETGCGLLTGV